MKSDRFNRYGSRITRRPCSEWPAQLYEIAVTTVDCCPSYCANVYVSLLCLVQRQSDMIEAERMRTAVTYSLITATQERCRLAVSTDSSSSLSDAQLMGQARKGQFVNVTSSNV